MSAALPDKGLAPGTRFGRYLIVRRLGAGGMATVHEARQTDIDKRVAVKTLHPELANRMDVVKRFVQEARAASRIEHPHVVAITDIGVEQGLPFLAMELLEGESLDAAIQREGALAPGRIADLLLPVISAVAAAHDKGILHRDLKPENVFLARRLPRGEHPVLLDFGISKINDGGGAQNITAAGELLGTPSHMAPEQVLFGMARLDGRADQYALGVLLYEAVCGALPFPLDRPTHALMVLIARGGARPPSAHRASVPPAFDALVARAMSVAPADRFPSVLHLGRALLPFASPLVQAIWSGEFAGAVEEVSAEVADTGATRALLPADVRAVGCLKECSDADLGALLALAPASRLAAGASLFTQGRPGDSLFLLLSGEVEIVRDAPPEPPARALLGPGALLGVSALGEPRPRPVSAVARTDLVVLGLPRQVFDTLAARLPYVAARLLGQLATDATRRLRAATPRLAELTAARARQKGARAAELAPLGAAVAEWSVPLDDLPGVSRRRG